MNGTLGLSILLGVLQTIGVILLWVLLILLIVILLILFVPICYTADGQVDDPEAHAEQEDPEAFKKRASGRFHFSWLFSFLSGGISWPDQPAFMIRILFWKIDVGEQIRKSRKKKEQKEQHSDKAHQEDRDTNDRNSGREKLKKLLQRLKEFRKDPGTESGKRAVSRILAVLTKTMKKILPRYWSIGGTVGFGDPELAGEFLQIEGTLIALSGDHIRIQPDYMKYRCDLKGHLKGRICLITILIAALQLLFDRDVRALIRFLRHPEKEEDRKRKGHSERAEQSMNEVDTEQDKAESDDQQQRSGKRMSAA